MSRLMFCVMLYHVSCNISSTKNYTLKNDEPYHFRQDIYYNHILFNMRVVEVSCFLHHSNFLDYRLMMCPS